MADNRGWKAGVARSLSFDARSRIIDIRDALEKDPDEYYTGDLAIQQKYEEKYSSEKLPSLRYINDILKAAEKSKPHKKKRRGTARYLCYPVRAVTRLGTRIADVDFVGHKFIRGVSEPLHFLSIAYRKPIKLRCIQRTNSETTDEAIAVTNSIFDECGWPDVVKTDVGTPFAGRGVRFIPRYAANLLKKNVTPVYGNPRSPWNQGTGEGSNSVFGKNFWGAHEFTSIEMVDERMTVFNASSKKYARWTQWIRETKDISFIPRICFIRKVGEDTRGKNGTIPIAGELISLPREYIGYFVFSEWHLKEQRLKIFFEREDEIQQIEERSFLINPKSQERCTDLFT